MTRRCPVCRYEGYCAGCLSLREDYENACVLVAQMHAAAVGEVRGPTVGVVEDVAAVRSALLEALAALQLARESLVEQNYRLYMNRKTCRCWGKMTGPCPNCAKSIKIENQGSEAVSLVDTALGKGEG